MEDRVSPRTAFAAWLSALAIAVCLPVIAVSAVGCTLSRGTLGGVDSGVPRADARPGDVDGGPRRDGGDRHDSDVMRPDAAGDCVSASGCPGPIEGDWDECMFDDACSELGSQHRTSTRYECEAGACVPHEVPESRDCPRSTDGMPCGGETCEDCLATAGGCGSTVSGSQSCTIMACGGGLCGTHVEMRSCMPPASPYCDVAPPWGSCDWNLFTFDCRRDRRRATCEGESCSGVDWETQPCTGC